MSRRSGKKIIEKGDCSNGVLLWCGKHIGVVDNDLADELSGPATGLS